MTRDTLNRILVLAVFGLMLPIGTAVFILGFMLGDSPCVLCWQQRTAMALIALIALFVIRYGPRPRYLGLAFLVSGAGVYMGIRHSALHLWRDVGQGFSLEILGAHTYTWSAFIFWTCVMVMGMLLLLLRDGAAVGDTRPLRPVERVAMWLFLVVIGGNIVQAFASTGPPPFMGQSDPVRFSFNPRTWVWSTEEWSWAPISPRGRWTIEKPRVPDAVSDPSQGPFVGLPTLHATRRQQLALPLDGPITDLAYEPSTDRFLLTTRHGVYITDGGLDRVARHTVIDSGYSVDLANFAGAAFLDPATVIAVSENKSYVVLRENDRVDPAANYRFFLESFDTFEEVTRSRFGTVRARMNYIMSAAYDPATNAIFTIAFPNSRSQRFVVSRFDRTDLTLSAEFVPTLAPDSGLAFQQKERGLQNLRITGATVTDGRVYALDAMYGTLVVIDPATHTVVGARTIWGVGRPTGIAIKGNELYVVSDTGALAVVPLTDR